MSRERNPVFLSCYFFHVTAVACHMHLAKNRDSFQGGRCSTYWLVVYGNAPYLLQGSYDPRSPCQAGMDPMHIQDLPLVLRCERLVRRYLRRFGSLEQ